MIYTSVSGEVESFQQHFPSSMHSFIYITSLQFCYSLMGVLKNSGSYKYILIKLMLTNVV